MSKARTIGALARELGVGVETIRFYERRGLIAQPPKSEGPRHYDDHTLATLRYLRLAQQLGFTLKEIQTLQRNLKQGKAFCESLRAMVERKLAALAVEMQAMEKLREELNAFLARCRRRDSALPCPILEELTQLYGAVNAGASRRDGRRATSPAKGTAS